MKLLLLLFAVPLMAQDRAFKVSLAAVSASAMLDAHSSMGTYELNPVVGRGPFGARQAATSLSITAGVLIAESLIVRKFPRMRRAFTWTNFGIAGVRGSTAIRNYSVQ